jgi:hypothetical protein
LRNREEHISGIIEEVEGRAKEAARKQREKIQALRDELSTKKKYVEGMGRRCEEELTHKKSIWSHIEQKLADVMCNDMPQMLERRVKRQEDELAYQRQHLICQKAELEKSCKKTRKMIRRAERELHDALEINQVFDLRTCVLEGEALQMELEIRSGELKEANGVPGLHINPDITKGVCAFLRKELMSQVKWFTDRCQPYELDVNTLRLTKTPSLYTPIDLMKCSRDLVTKWKKHEEHVLEKMKGRERRDSGDSTTSRVTSPGSTFSPQRSFADAADSSPGGSSPLNARASVVTIDSSQQDALASTDASRQIPYQACLELHASVEPEDHEKEKEAEEATRKAFIRSAGDLIMEAILKRARNDSFRHKFLKECVSCLKPPRLLTACRDGGKVSENSWKLLGSRMVLCQNGGKPLARVDLMVV